MNTRLHNLIHSLWTAAADAVFGPRCRHGCGQRIYPKDRDRHEDLDHAGDRLGGGM